MFMKCLGADAPEQIRAIISIVILVCLFILTFLIVFNPEFGSKASEKTISMEIVTALIALTTLCIGYLAGKFSVSYESKDLSDGKK